MPDSSVAKFNPSDASAEEWAQFHDYRRRRHTEGHPEEPFEPDHLAEIELRREDPRNITEVIWARIGDQVVAVARLWAPRPGSADYDSQRGILWFDLYVLKGHRGQRIANSFLPALLELSRTHEGRVLGTEADEADGLAAVEAFGFKKKSEQRHSRLDLSAIDWTAIERWAEEGRRRSPDRSFQLDINGPPREEWDDYCVAMTHLFNTIPFDDEEHGDFIFTPAVLGDQINRLAESDATMLRILIREADRRITAVTEIVWFAAQPEHARQWLTAVHSSVQGNGIGRWIKSAMLLHVHEHFPMVRWVLTDNASSNGPMLKINVDLGFRPYRIQSNFQMGQDEFARAVEARR